MIAAFDAALSTLLTDDAALVELLRGDTTAIWNKIAPDSAELPYVVFDADDVELNDTPRRARDIRVNIMAVDMRSAQQAAQIDARIDALIHQQELSVTGFNIWWQRRVRGISFEENTDSGRVNWHVGAEYLVRMEASS